MNIPKSSLMTSRQVYGYFEKYFPNRSIYRLIGAYSNKTLYFIKRLQRERISINRIIDLSYCNGFVKNCFLVTYKKRHYGRVDTIRLYIN